MTYFRRHWPTHSITPKMHLVEDHAIPFIKKWKSGFGLNGEQGMESLHASFNSLKLAYAPMKSPIQRLQAMMREHYMRVNPDSFVNKAKVNPQPRKKCKKNDS